MKRGVLLMLLMGFNSLVIAQSPKDSLNNKTGDSGFKEYYPIHVKPSIGYLSSLNEYEDILFDAKPTVYYSFYNNMRSIMQNSIHKPSYAVYLAFSATYQDVY